MKVRQRGSMLTDVNALCMLKNAVALTARVCSPWWGKHMLYIHFQLIEKGEVNKTSTRQANAATYKVICSFQS